MRALPYGTAWAPELRFRSDKGSGRDEHPLGGSIGSVSAASSNQTVRTHS